MPKIHIHYLEPERAPLKVAKAQRLTALLERDPRFADIPNFAQTVRALSPVPHKIDTALSNLKLKKGSKVDPRRVLTLAALSSFTANDFSDPSKRANYRELRKAQLRLQELATRGGRKNVSPTGGDKRHYNPAGKAFAATVHGTRASFRVRDTWLPVFARAAQVIPCIQRKVRREVMFATARAGRGYKVKHRRTWSSGVPC